MWQVIVLFTVLWLFRLIAVNDLKLVASSICSRHRQGVMFFVIFLSFPHSLFRVRSAPAAANVSVTSCEKNSRQSNQPCQLSSTARTSNGILSDWLLPMSQTFTWRLATGFCQWKRVPFFLRILFQLVRLLKLWYCWRCMYWLMEWLEGLIVRSLFSIVSYVRMWSAWPRTIRQPSHHFSSFFYAVSTCEPKF